jgi:hypothetical protein
MSASRKASRSILSRRLLLVSLAAVAVFSGCRKDLAPVTVATAPPEPVVLPEVPKAPVMARVTRPIDNSAGTLLRYLPRDSGVVIGVNWSRARQSEFVTGYDDEIRKAFPDMELAKSKCGFEPLTVVHSAALAMGPDPAVLDDVVLVVSGDFDRASLEACVITQGGKVEGDRYNGTTNVYWPASNVIVISNVKSSEELGLIPSASVWDSDKLMELVDPLDLHAVFWMAGTIPASAASTLPMMGTLPWGGHAKVDITTELDFDIGLQFTEPKEAKEMLTMLNMGMQMGLQQPQVSGLLKVITMEAVDRSVVIRGLFSGSQLTEIRDLIRKFAF